MKKKTAGIYLHGLFLEWDFETIIWRSKLGPFLSKESTCTVFHTSQTEVQCFCFPLSGVKQNGFFLLP